MYATEDYAKSPEFQAFAQREPEVANWMVERRKTFEFACSLLNAVLRSGDLTPKQMEAAKKCVAKSGSR